MSQCEIAAARNHTSMIELRMFDSDMFDSDIYTFARIKMLRGWYTPYIHTYIHTHTHTYIHTSTEGLGNYIHTYIHTYVHTYLERRGCGKLHTYIHTYIHREWYTPGLLFSAQGVCPFIYTLTYLHTHITTDAKRKHTCTQVYP
jgi:hypothetical protein